jgi:hypothetical protein
VQDTGHNAGLPAERGLRIVQEPGREREEVVGHFRAALEALGR